MCGLCFPRDSSKVGVVFASVTKQTSEDTLVSIVRVVILRVMKERLYENNLLALRNKDRNN